MRARGASIAVGGTAIAVALAIGPGAAGTIGQPPREFVRVVDRAWHRVGLTVSVSDARGRPIAGLGRDRFRLFEDDEAVEIADFGIEGERRDRPLSIALLLDMSESMGSQVGRVREAAVALLGQLRPQDEIMVAKFNDQITILQPFTAAKEDPERTLRNLGRTWGGTALFRSIEETVKDLRDRPGRKIILALSDGDDTLFNHDGHVLQSIYMQDLLRLCARTETTVYGVRPGMSIRSWSPFEGLVSETGGRLLYTGGDLERLFARLGEEFMSQYYLAYDIDPKLGEGRRRRLRVEVDHPGAIVRAMRGYFTPASHLDTLLRDLGDRDEALRSDAARELGFVEDDRAVPGLLAALRDRAAPVRLAAAEGLGRRAAPEAIPRLVEALSDDSEAVRAAAAAALVRIGSASLPRLLDLIRRDAGRRRPRPRLILAARAAGEIGDERAIDPLAALLAAGAGGARTAAAAALGDLGLSGGIAPLRSSLGDADGAVREAALVSIARIAAAAARPLIEDHLRREPDPAVQRRARELLESM
jgi:VWFA-related protein